MVVPYKRVPQVSRLPMLALIFGALSLPLVACFPFGATSAVAGIVLGILGIRAGDRGQAVAGVVFGVVGIVLQILVWGFFTAMVDAPSPT
ncbi:hypothetical protein OHA21_27745 [Actinoplanes sp. NBC_00393]|uniref:hypothetical protein n=1 Tax=Actinoplanes sp. NBC_00393 TaxID=2975953 RepID=UPI002E1D6D56